MVMKLIKNIFKKNEEIIGDLSTKDDTLSDCTIEISELNLKIKNKVTEHNFDIQKLTDVKITEKALSFTYQHKKYKFISKSDIKDIFTKIHPLSSTCTELFSSTDFKYKIFDTKSNNFKEVNNKLLLRIVEDDKLYYLKIESDDDVIHFEEITTETQYYMENTTNTFVWSVMKDNIWYTFCIVFDSNIDYLEFLSKYVSCTYKSSSKEENIQNEEYFEKMEIENYNLEKDEEEFCSLSEEEDEEENDLNYKYNNTGKDKNEHLIVGNERAFVTRGSSVGVFANTKEGLEFRENLSGIMKNPAKKVISHDKCKKLIYLDKNDTTVLHKIDLDRPDVVESWNINRNVNDYFDGSKMVDSETLVGLSDYSVFRIDPRTKDKITQSKEYKTKNEFMCGMSTSSGHVAVASKGGDLRLYDKIDKRAKSLLPGFGDEVKYVDVTSNGQNIICTCKNYLLLYTVDGNYKNQVGKDKPVPKRLTLRPEHLAYINEEINFTPAKFSTDSNESSIITSTGKYVVKWNLMDVLRGKVFSYQLSKCSDLVVADNFEFGDNDNIIVTMPDDVKSLKGSVLRRPNKNTFDKY
ncbi:hypothetical protein P3W45_000626 [Vairimorpha bombi]|jgi:hypothetical protein